MTGPLGATNNDNKGLFDGVHDFFHSGTWLVVRNLAFFFVAVFWLSTAYWVYKDARRRIEDPWLVAIATLLGLVPPFLGAIIYMFFRPPEYLDDVRERELEMQAAEARLYQLTTGFCPHCDQPVEKDFLRCPSCLRKLKDPCPNCRRPLDPAWRVCPFCEAEVAPPERAARRRRRRPDTSEREALTET